MKTYSKDPGNEQLSYINCPVCGSQREKHFMLYDFGSYSFKRCSVCSLVFQNPQPVFEDISKRYDKEYFEYEIKNEESFFSLMMMALSDIGFFNLDFPADTSGNAEFRNEAANRSKLLGGVKSILDIGCATGRLLYEFKKNGWNTAGVEICSEAAEWGNKNRMVNIKNCTLEQAAFKEKSFSVVHASHLIEHLNNPASFLKEVYRILMDNGYLILVTPNIESFQNFVFRAAWRSAIADHLFLYSVKTLRELCESNSFVFLKKGTWGGIPSGKAPIYIKNFFDSFAKKIGIGDVMVLLFKKSKQNI